MIYLIRQASLNGLILENMGVQKESPSMFYPIYLTEKGLRIPENRMASRVKIILNS